MKKTHIAPISQYYLKDGIFYKKSTVAQAVKYFLMAFVLIYGLLTTQPSTGGINNPSENQYEKFTWNTTKSKFVGYIQTANKTIDTVEANLIVKSTMKWASYFDVKPELILAITKVESGFDRYAISNMGAMGLMQVLFRVHQDKIVLAKKKLGNPEIFDIDTNIYIGSTILNGCLEKFKLENALERCYNGNTGDPNGYSNKVMTEYQRLLKI